MMRVTIIILSVLCILLSPKAGTAGVISIKQVAGMNFATLQVPYSKKHTIEVYSDRDKYSGNGRVLFGTPNRGEYMIAGEEGSSATIDIQNVRTGSPYVELANFQGHYGGDQIRSFPHSGIILSNKGKVLYLGAKVTYTKDVVDGGLSPSFDVVVNYE